MGHDYGGRHGYAIARFGAVALIREEERGA
jgi:hypothetical protein